MLLRKEKNIYIMSNYKDNSGLDTTKPKTSKEEMDRMMKEFLEKGGKIQKLRPGSAAVLGSLDKSKKPQWNADEIKKGKQVQHLYLIIQILNLIHTTIMI